MMPLAVVSYEYDEDLDVNTQYRRYFKYHEKANEYLVLQHLSGHLAWLFKTDSEEFSWIKE